MNFNDRPLWYKQRMKIQLYFITQDRVGMTQKDSLGNPICSLWILFSELMLIWCIRVTQKVIIAS